MTALRHIVAVSLLLTLCTACKDRKPSKRILSSTILEISDTSLSSASIPDTILLGRVKEGEIILKDVSILNRLNTPLLIKNIETDCGCLLFNFRREPMKPSESATFEMSFNSRGYYGRIEKGAAVIFNDKVEKQHFVVVANVE